MHVIKFSYLRIKRLGINKDDKYKIHSNFKNNIVIKAIQVIIKN